MSEAKRYCYWVDPKQDSSKTGGFCPSLVIENETGHYPSYRTGTPWVWGKSLKEAEKACWDFNHRLGLTDDEIKHIIFSGLGIKIVRKKSILEYPVFNLIYLPLNSFSDINRGLYYQRLPGIEILDEDTGNRYKDGPYGEKIYRKAYVNITLPWFAIFTILGFLIYLTAVILDIYTGYTYSLTVSALILFALIGGIIALFKVDWKEILKQPGTPQKDIKITESPEHFHGAFNFESREDLLEKLKDFEGVLHKEPKE